MNINELMREYAEYKRIKEEAENMLDSLKLAIIAEMGDNETLQGNEHKATFKTVFGSRIDTTAIKKELPEIAKQYTITTESKRFTFT